MRFVVLSLLGLLGICGTASSGGYGYSYAPYYSYSYAPAGYTYYPAATYNGYYYPAGYYTYANGYWYMYGVGYMGPTATYTAVSAPAYSADWRTKLLDVAAKRDDIASYDRSVTALGLQQPMSPGYAGAVAGYATPNLGAYGINGSSIFGYTVQQAMQTYGSLDMNALFQQSARLGQGAQSFASQATADFNSLLGQAGQNQVRVAEAIGRAAQIQAAGQALAGTLQSANPNTASVTTSATVVQPNAAAPQQQQQAQPNAQQAQPADNLSATFLQTVATPQCGSCHSGQSPKGKFDIAVIPQLDSNSRAALLWRLTTRDASKGMPRDAGNKHVPLNDQQLAAWFKYLLK